jgi:hypothetical protein
MRGGGGGVVPQAESAGRVIASADIRADQFEQESGLTADTDETIFAGRA